MVDVVGTAAVVPFDAAGCDTARVAAGSGGGVVVGTAIGLTDAGPGGTADAGDGETVVPPAPGHTDCGAR